MFVRILPLSGAALGAYPSTVFGPALYSGNILVLVAIYTFDLALSRRTLIPTRVERPLLNQIGAVAWVAICFLVSFGNPHLAIAGVVAYVVLHWVSIWWYEPQLHIARAAIEMSAAAGTVSEQNFVGPPPGFDGSK